MPTHGAAASNNRIVAFARAGLVAAEKQRDDDFATRVAELATAEARASEAAAGP